MIVTRIRPRRARRVDERLDLLHRLRRAHDDDLVAGRELGGAARHEQLRAALDRDDQRAARQMQLAERRRGQRRRRRQLVLEQPDHAAGKHLGVDRARARSRPARCPPPAALPATARGRCRIVRGVPAIRERSRRATPGRSSAGLAMRLAIAQATMLTSSRPVQATKNCAFSMPARAEHLFAGAAADDELDVDRVNTSATARS